MDGDTHIFRIDRHLSQTSSIELKIQASNVNTNVPNSMVKYVDFMYIFKKKGTSLEGIYTGNIPPCKKNKI